MLEKKYFETFMVESRKENKDLKEQIVQGDRETIEKIKAMAREDVASRKSRLEIDKSPFFNGKDKTENKMIQSFDGNQIPENVSEEMLSMRNKKHSAQNAQQQPFNYLTGIDDSPSRAVQSQFEM
jgi:hypothetical protein